MIVAIGFVRISVFSRFQQTPSLCALVRVSRWPFAGSHASGHYFSGWMLLWFSLQVWRLACPRNCRGSSDTQNIRITSPGVLVTSL